MTNNVLVCKQPNISWINPTNIDNSVNANNFNVDYLDTLNKLRGSNLKILELREIADKISDGPFGSQLKVEEYKEQGFPVYRVKNIIDTQISDDDIVYIDAKKQQQLKRSEVLPGDVLITKAGRIGSAAVVPSKFRNGNITSHLVLVRLKERINNYYLVAYLECKYGKVITARESYKSTRPELTKNEIGNVIIPIPSPEIQKYIGDKVRKAEELREEAKRLKKEAEEILESELGLEKIKHYVGKMSQKKYSWVKNKQLEDRIDGDFYKSKYNYFDELDNLSRLEKFYKISKKRINRNLKGQIKYIDLSSVNSIIEPNKYNINDLPSRAQFLVENGDLIVSTLKGSNKISIIPEYLKGSVCSTGFVVINSKSHLTTEYLYMVFTNKLFNMQIERYSTGSIMNAVNHDDFNKMYIPIISDKQKVSDITYKVSRHFKLLYQSKQLIQEAKKDVEDLIEGNFDMSKVKANN